MKIEIETNNIIDIKIIENNYDKINTLIKRNNIDNKSHFISEIILENKYNDQNRDSILCSQFKTPIKKIKLDYIIGYSNNTYSFNYYQNGFIISKPVTMKYDIYNSKIKTFVGNSKCYHIFKVSNLYKFFLIDNYYHYNIKYYNNYKYSTNLTLIPLIKLGLLDFKL